MAVTIDFRCHPELKAWIAEESLRRGVPMNDVISEIIANAIGKPELAKIPRKIGGVKPRQPELTTA